MKKIIDSIKKGLFFYQEPDIGYIISIKTAKDLMKAAEIVRNSGIKRFDCFTPFPIHGLEKAMGIERSWINIFTLIGALVGGISIFMFAVYVLVMDWPLNIGGKPNFSWPAFIPFTFEIAVLLAGFATVGSVIFFGKLNKPDRKPILPDISSDKFAIWIGENIKREEVDELMSGIKTEDIQKINTNKQEDKQ